jgi:TPR repeat protein
MLPTATFTPHQESPIEIQSALSDARFLAESGRFTEAIEVLMPYANSGNRNVLFSIGYAHHRRRAPGDRAQAESYLKDAASLGHRKASDLISRRNLNRWIGSFAWTADFRPLILHTAKAFLPPQLLNDLDVCTLPTQSLAAAVKPSLESKAEQGDTLAQMTLAVTLLNEETRTAGSTARAIDLLQAAVDDGRIEAVRFLGMAYLEGKLLDRDPKRAFGLFEFGTQLGCTDCRHRLAECYLDGVGVESDAPQATTLLEENTQLGHASSPWILGRALIEGIYLPKNVPAGLKLLRLAASRRCSAAAVYLSHFLRQHPNHSCRNHEADAYAVIAGERFGDSHNCDLVVHDAKDLPALMETVRHIESFRS